MVMNQTLVVYDIHKNTPLELIFTEFGYKLNLPITKINMGLNRKCKYASIEYANPDACQEVRTSHQGKLIMDIPVSLVIYKEKA